ncbi:MAG: DUF4097 domain-containing protein [Lachnospiraceae bacterium]|nr:DUF4097 domain-containing protein [Lachnospiraceae bacterium]
MVKRRKTIIISIVCMLIVAIFLLCYMNEDTIQVHKEWLLSGEEISKVEIIGLGQDLDIIIKESDGLGNRVTIEGNIPESFAKKIEELEPQKDSMSINFVGSSGVSIAKIAKDTLQITICLENDELLRKLTVKSNKGDVNLTVPSGFRSKYQLSTNYGDINALEEYVDTDREVSIELGSGNITISDK